MFMSSIRFFLVLAVLVALPLGQAYAGKKTKPWTNPGGKWMPQQMLDNAQVLEKLGIKIDPKDLSDPASKVMKAIISLGYCSGSFISKSGLIITNHHCVQKMLTYLSNKYRAKDAKFPADFTEHGFMARKLSHELNGGPTERIFITQKFANVTKQVLDGLEDIQDPHARYQELEKRMKEIVANAEKGRPEIRAEVKSFFRGEQFFLIEKLEIRDVRLVYVPENGIGWFGGDIDNWEWPRHTGDFAMIRAYVGPDGKPADYSPDNVPYQPEEFLKVSAKGMKAGDLVMVAGYPGSTSRLDTADQVGNQMDLLLPKVLDVIKSMIQKMEELSAKNDQIRVKTEDKLKSFNNVYKNRLDAIQAVKKVGVVAKKREMETQMNEWLHADPARLAQYGDVLNEMSELRKKADGNLEGDMLLGWTLRSASLLASADRIVEMAIERAKPDADRKPEFQQRTWARMRQMELAIQSGYNRTVDVELTTLVLEKALAMPQDKRPEWLGDVLNLEKLKAGVTVKQQIEALYAATALENPETRVSLLDNGSIAALEGNPDPIIQMALKLRPLLQSQDDRSRTLSGEMILVTPRYIKALRAFLGKPVAPDANSTLRVTFGQVKGYTDANTGEHFAPFTNTSQMKQKVEKNEWKDPFTAPKELIRAIIDRRFSEYMDPMFGEVSVNFLADVDTTGGNSGSAALNAKGELIGLLFDGTKQSLHTDWMFTESNRSILLDMRYALWTMDEVHGMHHLLAEMDIQRDPCAGALTKKDGTKK